MIFLEFPRKKMGRKTIERNFNVVKAKIISSLGQIREMAADRELIVTTNSAIMFLGTLGLATAKNNLEETVKAAKRSLNTIAAISRRRDLRAVTEGADQCSKEIEAVMNKNKGVTDYRRSRLSLLFLMQYSLYNIFFPLFHQLFDLVI